MRETDRRFMQLALVLGERTVGATWPNPAVGCVLVRDGRIVGRGWTQPGGRPHAETMAIEAAGGATVGATAYVTLEPCAHQGVTPACCDALVAAGIRRAVVALRDPDPRVDGRGIARLRDAGVAVDVGCLEAAARRSHAGFLSRLTRGRPFVTLKLATSLDGKIAAAGGRSRWITGDRARAAAHLLRARHDAVMIGSGTAVADDPELTCRLPGLGPRSPTRVVLDRRLRLDPRSRLVGGAGRVPLWVIADRSAPAERRQALSAAGVDVLDLPDREADRGGDLSAVLALLAGRGITRLLVEGGADVATALLVQGLVDRLVQFVAPIALGSDGVPLARDLGIADPEQARRWTIVDEGRLGEDRLVVYEPA